MLIFPPPGETSWRELEEALIDRAVAKLAKNWKKSDEIRDKLLEDGIVLRDVGQDVYWTRLHVNERAGMNEEWAARFVPLYKRFAGNELDFDWSDEALLAAYRYETMGEGDLAGSIFSIGKVNGYAYGKKAMDIAISGWKDLINEGLLCKNELYEEMPELKDWINKVLCGAVLSDEGVKFREGMINENRRLVRQ